MKISTKNIFIAIISGIVVFSSGCGNNNENTGLEYAPNMYHSVPYEPLTQITDKSSGMWVNSSEDEIGEYYNSNPNNPHGMNMLEPVKGTIARRAFYASPDSGANVYLLAERIPADSLVLAARVLENPLPDSPEILDEGKTLYLSYCQHCHGKQGNANGKVAEQYPGVPKYSSRALQDITGGHIFHVITHGKGRMWPHGSQVRPEDRWKIVRYVQKLQKGES